MFCDQTIVKFVAGKGGDGCVSFRRERYVANGGPDGGNGGGGGDIVLRVDESLNTLSEFHLKKQFHADDGDPGSGNKCHGKSAADLVLKVPPGTMVFDGSELISDLSDKNDDFVVVSGGRGGKGNANFTSPTRQAPSFAESGELGERRTVRLELRLVADIGLIGLPSVGKSTIISVISNARPKIADYHFTTLIPNLGVVTMSRFGGTAAESFVAADIPGLIEGAHKGKGLGDQFLRHVLRTTVLVHVLDATHDDTVADYLTVRNELTSYSAELENRSEVVALNKIDAVPSYERHIKALAKIGIAKVYPVSAAAGKGLKELLRDTYALYEAQKVLRRDSASAADDEKAGYRVFRPHEEDERRFVVEKIKGGFRISGRKIERIVQMSDLTNIEARARVYDVLRKMGIDRELSRYNVQPGDRLFIGEWELPFLG